MAAVAMLICFPNVNFGQAPKLGTVANFVLFSSHGAVSNTGISQITGNVGTNSGSSTAFGNVNGVMHDNDSASAQCSKDLLKAYNLLDSATPTAHPSSSLGGGDTLVAGIYSISGASKLSGTLYLNAKGNANAVFIFQLDGAFSAGASSKVTLINGAVACNVFWKIEGLVSLASGTTMRGTIIANNAAIKMGTGDTLEGRALSTTGAVTVDGVLAYTPIGCGSPTLKGPVAPDLGTTMCYALFSGDGSVSNTGTSNITGDVGTNVGSTKGFDSTLVKGSIHLIPDSSTKLAAADLTKAYNYLDSLAYDIELLYPAKFGSNLVLTPHTYVLNAATVLTDSVYLNAQGDSNAVFVIQINGALTTSTYASVILTNGALAKNVYWKVKGAVSINNYSIFRGTIISNAGALSALNTGVVINGRLLTTAGALTTAAVKITMPPGCTANLADSVKITKLTGDQTLCSGGSVSFSVTATGSGISYQWRKGSVNLSNGGNITGATSDKLTISPVAVADIASDYNVVISSSFGPDITSTNIALTVNTAPFIITIPVSQSACLGTSASFSVAATGTALTYQWRIGTANLSNGGNISGATSDVLIIDPVRAADSASNYNVDISGTCQSNNISKNITLSINTKPVITTSPLSQMVILGSSVSFSVGATGTGLTYQWKRGTTNLTNGGNISGADSDKLTINPVAASDSATNYYVVINGSCAQITTSSDVSLSISPKSGIAPVEAGNNTNAATIFPNPFSTSLSFRLNDARQMINCELRIYNSLGKEVLHTLITAQTTSIETGNFVAGVYYYNLVNNNQIIQSGKLVSVK